jgi:CRP/FNR family cyclic AMP-dependent transcriptional regulator
MIARKTNPGVKSLDDGIVRYLRSNRFFRYVGDEVLMACLQLFSIVSLPKGARLHDSADDSPGVYLLKSGVIRLNLSSLDGREVAVALLGAGDIFGLDALFGKMESRTTAICLEDSLVCSCRAERLYPMITKYPSLLMNVASYLWEQGERTISTVEEIAFLTVQERIERILDRLATEHGVPHPQGTRIALRLTHLDLATLIGSTRETVSTQLRKLQEDGRLIIQKRSFIVPRPL